MRRSYVGLARRVASVRPPDPPPPRPDARALRDERISQAQETIFGPQGSMPGDRYFRKNLEGQKLMRWYFPSKYGLPDFRVDDYFEMQAERMAPREAHPSVPNLTATLRKISQRRDELKQFFGSMDEATFLSNPSLHDLYGLFRLVDSDHALPFEVPEAIFKEQPPFQGGLAETPEDLMLRIEASRGGGGGEERALRARVSQTQKEDDYISQLHSERERRHVVPDFSNVVVVPETSGGRKHLRAYAVGGHTKDSRAKLEQVKKTADEELKKARTAGPKKERDYLNIRNRFIDPMYRRRRLKWLERQMADQHNEKERKFNSYYATHPDDTKDWPTNKASVTVVWPSPYH
eukprot:TRINITY_DN30580_c0_g1_i1.p1 TRINITY_DN30580_c0_g1~~TRINITY_DN30580_c0_g1_i1.p1  ORF type:complete len:348 (-),score=72.37 TRINITY_DN30580_c0_g1_i1:64-1107(-)